MDNPLKKMLEQAEEYKQPREKVLFQSGSGALRNCIEEYIKIETKASELEGKTFDISCSYITELEERFFNEILFDLILNENYVYDSELLIMQGNCFQITGLTPDETYEIVKNYALIQITVKDELEKHASFIGEPFQMVGKKVFSNSDEVILLKIASAFLKACLKVDNRMNS